ncbi:MAG: exodeoxyribonuclease VII small subunit [Butyrivibrio sp.]
MKIEEAFETLDSIISGLENKDTTLEEALKEYEKGVKIVRECNESLDMVEKQIIILQNHDEETGE